MHTKLFRFSTILFICIATLTILGCEKDSETSDENDKAIAAIKGKWTVNSGTSYALDDDGEQIVTATLKPNVLGYEFLANGNFTAYEYVSNTSENGSWKLEDVKQSNTEIDAILAITTPSLQGSKGESPVDADGYQRYYIGISSSEGHEMNWISKKYEAYPYNKNWIEILLSKD